MESLQRNEKIFLDTSALTALFLKTEGLNSLAKKIWKGFKEEECRLYTSEYVLDELITLLAAKASHHFACEVGESIIKSSVVKLLYIQDDQVTAIFDRFKKYRDKNFSFTDVSSFYLMELEEIEKAFTFDRDFSRAGFITLPQGA